MADVRAAASPYAPTRSARSVSTVTRRKLRASAAAGAGRSVLLPLQAAQSRSTPIGRMECLERRHTGTHIPTDTDFTDLHGGHGGPARAAGRRPARQQARIRKYKQQVIQSCLYLRILACCPALRAGLAGRERQKCLSAWAVPCVPCVPCHPCPPCQWFLNAVIGSTASARRAGT